MRDYYLYILKGFRTTTYSYCDGHYISISVCGMWGARAEVQVFRNELHKHINLDNSKIEFLYCIKKKRIQKVNYLLIFSCLCSLPLIIGHTIVKLKTYYYPY